MRSFLCHTNIVSIGTTDAAASSSSSSSFLFQCHRSFAGHNKWSKIRHKKGKNDVARAAALGRASRRIIAAARQCHGDVSDLQLQSALAHAREVQLPKDRIEDALAKGSGKGGSREDGDHVKFEHVRYDGMLNFAGTKVAFILQALTDNRNRTAQQVRAMITKFNGEMLSTGKLNHIFEFVGVALLENIESGQEDYLYDCAIENGALDIDLDADSSSGMIYCEPSDLYKLVQALQKEKFPVTQFEQRYIVEHPDDDYDDSNHSTSVVVMEPRSPARQEMEAFLDKLDENEDITHYYHNAHFLDDYREPPEET
jgi:transcriptional/translational regulatory protein YebC/TACO1